MDVSVSVKLMRSITLSLVLLALCADCVLAFLHRRALGGASARARGSTRDHYAGGGLDIDDLLFGDLQAAQRAYEPAAQA